MSPVGPREPANLSVTVSDGLRNVRNIAIVLGIAAAVYFLPSGGQAANTFEALLYIGFGVAIGYIGLRVYRENRVALHGLGDRYRGLLYGSIALAFLLWMSRVRMWRTGVGELLWFVLAGGIVYALVLIVKRWRAY